MADLARVLDRVRKLLALATSSNVFEAAEAAAQAQALIDRHRLEALLQEQVEAPITDGSEASLERARRPRVWRGVLAAGLAEANGCLAWSTARGGETELCILGREGDRAVVVALFEWLAPRIEWLSATHAPGRDRAYHDAFRVGAAGAVVERLRSPPDAPAVSPEDAALVRVNEALAARRAAVEAFAEARLGPARGRGLRLDARAYARGRARAAELSLPSREGGLQRRGGR